MTLVVGKGRGEDYPAFEVNFFNRPIEEVMCWVGGYHLAQDSDKDRNSIFSRKSKWRELDVSTPVPALPIFGQINEGEFLKVAIMALRGLSSVLLWTGSTVLHLYSVEGCEELTVVESENEITNGKFPFAYMGHCMQCEFFSFRYGEHEPGKYHASIRTSPAGAMPRLIYVHEEGGWQFYERGTPRDWEDVDRYKAKVRKKRLDAQYLVDCMARLGMNFEAFQDRRFSRAIEFSVGIGGNSLSGYEEEAKYIASHRTLGCYYL